MLQEDQARERQEDKKKQYNKQTKENNADA